MARVYATADDVINWIGDYPPANVDTLLARASLMIDELLVAVVYDTDDNGMPTDTTVVIPTMRDAVCAQVAWWIPPVAPREDGSVKDSWPRMATATRPDPVVGGKLTRPDVAPDVGRILRVAGMYPSHPRLTG